MPLWFGDREHYTTLHKQLVSTITSCHGSSPTAIRMRHQYVTINYATHGIYVHIYYFFINEANDPKIFSAGNDTNATKHDLPEKILQCCLRGKTRFALILVTEKYPPRTTTLRSSSPVTTTHLYTKLYIP